MKGNVFFSKKNININVYNINFLISPLYSCRSHPCCSVLIITLNNIFVCLIFSSHSTSLLDTNHTFPSRLLQSGLTRPTPQYAFRGAKLHGRNFADSFLRRRPNIVKSCVKVPVVVINKRARRDLVFDRKGQGASVVFATPL